MVSLHLLKRAFLKTEKQLQDLPYSILQDYQKLLMLQTVSYTTMFIILSNLYAAESVRSKVDKQVFRFYT